MIRNHKPMKPEDIDRIIFKGRKNMSDQVKPTDELRKFSQGIMYAAVLFTVAAFAWCGGEGNVYKRFYNENIAGPETAHLAARLERFNDLEEHPPQ